MEILINGDAEGARRAAKASPRPYRRNVRPAFGAALSPHNRERNRLPLFLDARSES